MAERGFRYFPPSQRGVVSASAPVVTMDAADYAAVYGFGISSAFLDTEDDVLPYENYVMSLTGEESLEYGAALQQCTEEVEGISAEQTARRSSAASFALDDFAAEVRADRRTLAALDDWQSCMAASGYEFDDPSRMRSTFAERASTSLPDELDDLLSEEVRVAVANVPCESTYLEAVRRVVEDRFADFTEAYVAALRLPDGSAVPTS